MASSDRILVVLHATASESDIYGSSILGWTETPPIPNALGPPELSQWLLYTLPGESDGNLRSCLLEQPGAQIQVAQHDIRAMAEEITAIFILADAEQSLVFPDYV